MPSIFYYDDINSKNVLVKDEQFVGIVDLDEVAYGDPLEAVGRIKASWFGTHRGEVYTSAIERGLQLGEAQREIVTVYALLHRICWLSEKGIQWNQNTSAEIDPKAAELDKRAVEALRAEIRAAPKRH